MAKSGGEGMFDLPEDWESVWQGLPEFVQEDKTAFDSITVQFRTAEDRRAFLEAMGERPDRRKSIWYPRTGYERQSDGETSGPVGQNRYPVYVISKGRYEYLTTTKALLELGIAHRIVVEPQEFGYYRRTIRAAGGLDKVEICVLPFSNLGQGSIPARNWVWEHSLGNGDRRHWILDDNIDGFYRLNNNRKEKVRAENPFVVAEELSDRYENVAISGLNYEFFVLRRAVYPPFYLNTRVYSCILIRNDLRHRWRGRYNEDTDLCLRVLKDGQCTILLNAYLAKKLPTMTMKGGNMEQLYAGDDGRLNMAESLREQHPDVVTVTRKWRRWQHHVDYRPFKRNKLKPKKESRK